MKFKTLTATTLLFAALSSSASAVIYTVNPNVTDSTTKTMMEIKTSHSRLPALFQKKIGTVEIYQKQDGVLGWSVGNGVHLNQQYLKAPLDTKHLRDLYYHESAHTLDYASFTSTYKGSNLFDGQYEVGMRNYSTGADFNSSLNPKAGGYRSKNLMDIKPSTYYTVSSNDYNNTVILMYNKDKKATRYITVSDRVMKTKVDEEYMAIYTVKPNLTLDGLSVRESSALNSLSRDNSFDRVFNDMKYPVGSYYSNKQEAFANVVSTYYMYKTGKWSRAELAKQGKLSVIPYMRGVEANEYKVNASLDTKINESYKKSY